VHSRETRQHPDVNEVMAAYHTSEAM
jgi:hypothetical protein